MPGHWEDDLIKRARNASSVATLFERTSLFVTLGKMENTATNAAVTSFGMILNRIDAQRRLSMTYDQGREMARHEQLCETTSITVYFAEPYSPWQRGRNENTNGLAGPVHAQGYGSGRVLPGRARRHRLADERSPAQELGLDVSGQLFMPESFAVRQHHHEIVALGDALRAQPAFVALQP
ncbi:MAG: IS30 family transposase [Burkholderia sp.]